MTSPAVEAMGLTKKYRETLALDHIDFTIEPNKLYGLLGRNGAGKTTIMSILTGQNFETAGEVLVFGSHPYENANVLKRVCFIRESQKYPDDFKPLHAFAAAAMFFEHWSQSLCDRLIKDFQLPTNRRIKKLSRGQLSAVGVIIGLASRAELTFFDEPYLGLDAVARQLFYDHLLADYAAHPRTILLSSHLIDEVANLLEHVIVVDQGKILMDDNAETIRNSAFTIVGGSTKVESFVAGREIIHRESFASLASLTVSGHLTSAERQEATELGLEIGPVSLQQLIVRRTISHTEAQSDRVADATEMEEVR